MMMVSYLDNTSHPPLLSTHPTGKRAAAAAINMGHDDNDGMMVVDATRVEALATAEAGRASDPAAMDQQEGGGEDGGGTGGLGPLKRPQYAAVNPNEMVRLMVGFGFGIGRGLCGHLGRGRFPSFLLCCCCAPCG